MNAPRLVQSFDFDINDKVKLIDIDRPGKITGILVGKEGVEYRVTFWHESQRRTEWLTVDEIKLKEPDSG